MPTRTDDFAPFEELLPQGATPLHAWRIVKFLDDEGEERFKWQSEGDPNLSQSIGMLELVQFDMIHSSEMSDHDE